MLKPFGSSDSMVMLMENYKSWILLGALLILPLLLGACASAATPPTTPAPPNTEEKPLVPAPPSTEEKPLVPSSPPPSLTTTFTHHYRRQI